MRRVTFLLAVGLITLGAAGTASAGFKAVSVASSGTANVIHQLGSVRTLLNSADHDYKGHRAAAVHQISQAINALHHHHQKHTKGMKGKGKGKGISTASRGNGTSGKAIGSGKGKGNKEPQAESDAKLKRALGMLNGLSNAPAQAKSHISAAIGDLNAALAVK